MTSLPSQPSSEILCPSGTNAPLQPLAENGVPLTYAQAAHHDVQRPRRPGRRRPLIGFAAFMATLRSSEEPSKRLAQSTSPWTTSGSSFQGAVAQGIFRKRAEARAERIVERINAMDPLKR